MSKNVIKKYEFGFGKNGRVKVSLLLCLNYNVDLTRKLMITRKKIRNIIGIAILVLIVAYGGVLFVMRDKSPNWCNLSWGTYDLQGSRSYYVDMRWSYLPVYGCRGGFFGFMDYK